MSSFIALQLPWPLFMLHLGVKIDLKPFETLIGMCNSSDKSQTTANILYGMSPSIKTWPNGLT